MTWSVQQTVECKKNTASWFSIHSITMISSLRPRSETEPGSELDQDLVNSATVTDRRGFCISAQQRLEKKRKQIHRERWGEEEGVTQDFPTGFKNKNTWMWSVADAQKKLKTLPTLRFTHKSINFRKQFHCRTSEISCQHMLYISWRDLKLQYSFKHAYYRGCSG